MDEERDKRARERQIIEGNRFRMVEIVVETEEVAVTRATRHQRTRGGQEEGGVGGDWK